MKGKARVYGNDDQVVALRRDGYSCRETARIAGIPEHQVWTVMRRHGMVGQIHARPERGVEPPSMEKLIEHCIDEYGVLTIEEGADGGYIATLYDEWTGPESRGVRAAITAAVGAAGGRSG